MQKRRPQTSHAAMETTIINGSVNRRVLFKVHSKNDAESAINVNRGQMGIAFDHFASVAPGSWEVHWFSPFLP